MSLHLHFKRLSFIKNVIATVHWFKCYFLHSAVKYLLCCLCVNNILKLLNCFVLVFYVFQISRLCVVDEIIVLLGELSIFERGKSHKNE